MSTHIDLFRETQEIQVRLEKIRDIGLQYFDLYSQRLRHDKKQPKTLKDKVVIVTGASSGIGRATALAYANKGAKLVLAARNERKLNEVEQEIRMNKGIAISVVTDVTIEQQCKNLIEQSIEFYGKIDVLVANAGISMRALFTELDLSVLKKLMDVNFWGTVYCTKYALPYLYKTNGSLIAISSVAAITPLPGRTGYCASKSAVNGFINSLRIENRKNKIHIMLVSPGFTDSNIRKTALNKYGEAQLNSPLKEGKLMSSEEVARKIVKATLSRQRSLILTMEAKLAFFINKFKPTFVERVIYHKMAKEPDSPFK
ncbi:MAG: SDR family oxidoreductase [Chlorobi bacterium]|nr:SDR family oxidoreductase [Chlorobiota bacterium]